jgi:hypothetical protein
MVRQSAFQEVDWAVIGIGLVDDGVWMSCWQKQKKEKKSKQKRNKKKEQIGRENEKGKISIATTVLLEAFAKSG